MLPGTILFILWRAGHSATVEVSRQTGFDLNLPGGGARTLLVIPWHRSSTNYDWRIGRGGRLQIDVTAGSAG
jgi:hypothetical protein